MTDMALCKELAKAIGAGQSPMIPKIFEALVTDDEAKVMLLAAPPATAEELAQKAGLTEEAVLAMMDSCFTGV